MVQDFVRTLRLINEDVITTSEACSHINAMYHLYATNILDNVFYFDAYQPDNNGKLNYKGSTSGYIKDATENVTKKGWYYCDGEKYIYCENQDNNAHPANPR